MVFGILPGIIPGNSHIGEQFVSFPVENGIVNLKIGGEYCGK
jgi:hypothetical protein